MLILSGICALAACSPKDHSAQFHDMRWLLGTWSGIMEGQVFYESWTNEGSDLFLNENFVLDAEGKRRVLTRSRIEVRDHEVYYTSGDKLSWILVECSPDRCVFENKEYQEKITFTHTPGDEWHTLLEFPSDTLKYELTRIQFVK